MAGDPALFDQSAVRSETIEARLRDDDHWIKHAHPRSRLPARHATSPGMSPPASECRDILSLPGESAVTSQVDFDSPSETKIAPRSTDSGRWHGKGSCLRTGVLQS